MKTVKKGTEIMPKQDHKEYFTGQALAGGEEKFDCCHEQRTISEII